VNGHKRVLISLEAITQRTVGFRPNVAIAACLSHPQSTHCDKPICGGYSSGGASRRLHGGYVLIAPQTSAVGASREIFICRESNKLTKAGLDGEFLKQFQCLDVRMELDNLASYRWGSQSQVTVRSRRDAKNRNSRKAGVDSK
jgi:hypothetical protein